MRMNTRPGMGSRHSQHRTQRERVTVASRLPVRARPTSRWTMRGLVWLRQFAFAVFRSPCHYSLAPSLSAPQFDCHFAYSGPFRLRFRLSSRGRYDFACVFACRDSLALLFACQCQRLRTLRLGRRPSGPTSLFQTCVPRPALSDTLPGEDSRPFRGAASRRGSNQRQSRIRQAQGGRLG